MLVIKLSKLVKQTKVFRLIISEKADPYGNVLEILDHIILILKN